MEKRIYIQYIFNRYDNMTSVQISVRKDVYEKLKKAKRPDESFSDTIERILGGKSNIQAFINLYGIAHHPDEQAYFDAFETGKHQIRESLKTRLRKQEIEDESL